MTTNSSLFLWSPLPAHEASPSVLATITSGNSYYNKQMGFPSPLIHHHHHYKQKNASLALPLPLPHQIMMINSTFSRLQQDDQVAQNKKNKIKRTVEELIKIEESSARRNMSRSPKQTTPLKEGAERSETKTKRRTKRKRRKKRSLTSNQRDIYVTEEKQEPKPAGSSSMIHEQHLGPSSLLNDGLYYNVQQPLFDNELVVDDRVIATMPEHDHEAMFSQQPNNHQTPITSQYSNNNSANQNNKLPLNRYFVQQQQHQQYPTQHKNKKPVYVSISQQTVNGLLSLLLLFIISICGCMGTIFIISALTVIESLQTRGNCYLVSLALSHLLVNLFVIPSSALQIMAGDGINTKTLCHYQWLTLEFTLVVSQLSFFLIAADNYLSFKSSLKLLIRDNDELAAKALQITTNFYEQQQSNPLSPPLSAFAGSAGLQLQLQPPNYNYNNNNVTSFGCSRQSGNMMMEAPTASCRAQPFEAASFSASFQNQAAALNESNSNNQRENEIKGDSVTKLTEHFTASSGSACSARPSAQTKKPTRLLMSNKQLTIGSPNGLNMIKTRSAESGDINICLNNNNNDNKSLFSRWNALIGRNSFCPSCFASNPTTTTTSTTTTARNCRRDISARSLGPTEIIRKGKGMCFGSENATKRKNLQQQRQGPSLANQFVDEKEVVINRGGCFCYKDCCGKLKVLFWIIFVWLVAFVYTIHQHTLSYGPKFCLAPVHHPITASSQANQMQQHYKLYSKEPGDINLKAPATTTGTPPSPFLSHSPPPSSADYHHHHHHQAARTIRTRRKRRSLPASLNTSNYSDGLHDAAAPRNGNESAQATTASSNNNSIKQCLVIIVSLLREPSRREESFRITVIPFRSASKGKILFKTIKRKYVEPLPTNYQFYVDNSSKVDDELSSGELLDCSITMISSGDYYESAACSPSNSPLKSAIVKGIIINISKAARAEKFEFKLSFETRETEESVGKVVCKKSLEPTASREEEKVVLLLTEGDHNEKGSQRAKKLDTNRNHYHGVVTKQQKRRTEKTANVAFFDKKGIKPSLRLIVLLQAGEEEARGKRGWRNRRRRRRKVGKNERKPAHDNEKLVIYSSRAVVSGGSFKSKSSNNTKATMIRSENHCDSCHRNSKHKITTPADKTTEILTEKEAEWLLLLITTGGPLRPSIALHGASSCERASSGPLQSHNNNKNKCSKYKASQRGMDKRPVSGDSNDNDFDSGSGSGEGKEGGCTSFTCFTTSRTSPRVQSKINNTLPLNNNNNDDSKTRGTKIVGAEHRGPDSDHVLCAQVVVVLAECEANKGEQEKSANLYVLIRYSRPTNQKRARSAITACCSLKTRNRTRYNNSALSLRTLLKAIAVAGVAKKPSTSGQKRSFTGELNGSGSELHTTRLAKKSKYPIDEVNDINLFHNNTNSSQILLANNNFLMLTFNVQFEEGNSNSRSSKVGFTIESNEKSSSETGIGTKVSPSRSIVESELTSKSGGQLMNNNNNEHEMQIKLNPILVLVDDDGDSDHESREPSTNSDMSIDNFFRHEPFFLIKIHDPTTGKLATNKEKGIVAGRNGMSGRQKRELTGTNNAQSNINNATSFGAPFNRRRNSNNISNPLNANLLITANISNNNNSSTNTTPPLTATTTATTNINAKANAGLLTNNSSSSGNSGRVHQNKPVRLEVKHYWLILIGCLICPTFASIILFARAYLNMKQFKTRQYTPIPTKLLLDYHPAIVAAQTTGTGGGALLQHLHLHHNKQPAASLHASNEPSSGQTSLSRTRSSSPTVAEVAIVNKRRSGRDVDVDVDDDDDDVKEDSMLVVDNGNNNNNTSNSSEKIFFPPRSENNNKSSTTIQQLSPLNLTTKTPALGASPVESLTDTTTTTNNSPRRNQFAFLNVRNESLVHKSCSNKNNNMIGPMTGAGTTTGRENYCYDDSSCLRMSAAAIIGRRSASQPSSGQLLEGQAAPLKPFKPFKAKQQQQYNHLRNKQQELSYADETCLLQVAANSLGAGSSGGSGGGCSSSGPTTSNKSLIILQGEDSLGQHNQHPPKRRWASSKRRSKRRSPSGLVKPLCELDGQQLELARRLNNDDDNNNNNDPAASVLSEPGGRGGHTQLNQALSAPPTAYGDQFIFEQLLDNPLPSGLSRNSNFNHQSPLNNNIVAPKQQQQFNTTSHSFRLIPIDCQNHFVRAKANSFNVQQAQAQENNNNNSNYNNYYFSNNDDQRAGCCQLIHRDTFSFSAPPSAEIHSTSLMTAARVAPKTLDLVEHHHQFVRSADCSLNTVELFECNNGAAGSVAAINNKRKDGQRQQANERPYEFRRRPMHAQSFHYGCSVSARQPQFITPPSPPPPLTRERFTDDPTASYPSGNDGKMDLSSGASDLFQHQHRQLNKLQHHEQNQNNQLRQEPPVMEDHAFDGQATLLPKFNFYDDLTYMASRGSAAAAAYSGEVGNSDQQQEWQKLGLSPRARGSPKKFQKFQDDRLLERHRSLPHKSKLKSGATFSTSHTANYLDDNNAHSNDNDDDNNDGQQPPSSSRGNDSNNLRRGPGHQAKSLKEEFSKSALVPSVHGSPEDAMKCPSIDNLKENGANTKTKQQKSAKNSNDEPTTSTNYNELRDEFFQVKQNSNSTKNKSIKKNPPQQDKLLSEISDHNKRSGSNNKVIIAVYSYMTDDQLVKSNIIAFIINLILWLPFVTLSILAQYRDHITNELKDSVWWFAVINCCSCSYIYALTNKDFREAFNKLFYYCCCKSHVTFQKKTPIFRRQLEIDLNGNLRVHIIPGLNVCSNRLSSVKPGATNENSASNYLTTATAGNPYYTRTFPNQL